MKRIITLTLTAILTASALANDGHQLWLGSNTPTGKTVTITTTATSSPTIDIAKSELQAAWQLGENISLVIDKSLKLGDGFRINTQTSSDVTNATITASTDIGLLYGAYDLLRMQNTWEINREGNTIKTETPAFNLRLLNHWDNLDGTIERGYAGKSIFWNDDNTDLLSPPHTHLIRDYARANASIGINGTVLNNVNASPKMLTTPYLNKVKDIANILRPYGIRVYLSINFATPMALGETKTADPLDKSVINWWKKKASEIYQLVPDFGGFLVKANSEGQPGPFDYNRTHAQGANMLADALSPYGGIVMWRCFVYGANHKGEDRVKQAVSEFKPLDGKFRKNVILQTKNGPLDFQPREPYSPIFDQVRKTPNMVELQITQEYLGQSRHLVYLAPMWREFFLEVPRQNLSGIAGVSNIGLDDNWCGHHFSQANWYAFGRLAWNPELTSNEIAREWLRQTFAPVTHCKPRTDDACQSAVGYCQFENAMAEVMMSSREACVDYMMPLGLHHIFSFDEHYGPEPDGFKPNLPLEWCPVYYHNGDKNGIGFNRTHTGSNAASQYREPLASIYDNIDTCPEKLLLWFHHVPWTHHMKSGRTLWEELQAHYRHGVSEVERYVDTWQRMRPYVVSADQGDERRWREVDDRMQHQLENARLWRDVCLRYFEQLQQ